MPNWSLFSGVHFTIWILFVMPAHDDDVVAVRHTKAVERLNDSQSWLAGR
jgi:hypothetical protein